MKGGTLQSEIVNKAPRIRFKSTQLLHLALTVSKLENLNTALNSKEQIKSLHVKKKKSTKT